MSRVIRKITEHKIPNQEIVDLCSRAFILLFLTLFFSCRFFPSLLQVQQWMNLHGCFTCAIFSPFSLFFFLLFSLSLSTLALREHTYEEQTSTRGAIENLWSSCWKSKYVRHNSALRSQFCFQNLPDVKKNLRKQRYL